MLTSTSNEDLNKPDIVEALDEHLQNNQTRLQNEDAFEAYYGATRRTPYKVRDTSDGGDVKSIVRGRGRRATKVKSEPE